MLTEQEQFWKGEFGNAYVDRHKKLDWRKRVPFWRSILDLIEPRSILEVGCNSGANLKAIRQALAEADADVTPVWGCDINQAAILEASDACLSVRHCSLFDAKSEFPGGFDLVLTCGVLIHVAPADLPRAMDSIISVSNRYVLAVEYAWDTEAEIEYRGHAQRLWKRPFGRLYESRGLSMVAEGEAPADAFDRCYWWILERS